MPAGGYYLAAPMAAKDLGSKYICFKCSTKFYDMKKPEPVCPKCGANQKDAKGDSSPTPSRARRSAAAAAAPVAPPPPPEPDLDEIEPVEGAVVADDDEEDLVFKGADGEEDEDEDEEE